jgi:CheY-like chemotaxis protein
MASKVLLVEDDSSFREVLALALELEGYFVCQVGGGREALEFLSGEQPDIIISDLEMNDMDGRALCERARRVSALSHIPFVILSAFVDPNIPGNLADLPADRCVSKQAPVANLVQLIRELLNDSHNKPQSGGI